MKKWGEQLDIRPPNLKIGGTCPLHPPLGLTPLNSSHLNELIASRMFLLQTKVNKNMIWILP